MDENRIKADFARLEKIERLRVSLREARSKLEAINRVAKEGKTWEITVYIGPPNANNWDRDRSENNYRFPVPVGVVQQSAIDAIRKLEREIVAAGGVA